MTAQTIEKTFAVESPAFLKVGNVRGMVDIRRGEEDAITVSAVKHGGGRDPQIIIEQDESGKVIVEARQENSVLNWFGLGKPGKVDFTVRVPRSCSVKLNCVSSEAVIEGVEGEFSLDSVSGDLELIDLQGDFRFNLVSADLQGRNLSGSMVVNTVSGDVRVDESHITSLTSESVSGDLQIQTSLEAGPYELKAVSGDLHLLPPEDQGCVVAIKSVSGGVKTSLPITEKRGDRSNQQVTILNGGPRVQMKSVSGDIYVGKRVESETAAPPAPPAPPAPVASPEPPAAARPVKSQMQILEEIDSGELSVEEALKILNPPR